MPSTPPTRACAGWTGSGRAGAGVLIATREAEAPVFIAPPPNVADSEVDLIMRALDRALAVTDAALSEHHEP